MDWQAPVACDHHAEQVCEQAGPLLLVDQLAVGLGGAMFVRHDKLAELPANQ